MSRGAGSRNGACAPAMAGARHRHRHRHKTATTRPQEGSRAVASVARRERATLREAREREVRDVRVSARLVDDRARDELADRRAELEAVAATARREVQAVVSLDRAKQG